MGIYYSSVGTRLTNYLRHEELTIEDFAVLSPEFIQFIHNLGRKSRVAVLERLHELNLNPGTWDGRDEGMTWYEAMRYYKEHRLELREKFPPQHIEKPETKEPEKPKDDWEDYRKKVATDIMMKLVGIGHFEERVDVYGHPITAFDAAYTPSAAADYAVKAADALIANLKKIH